MNKKDQAQFYFLSDKYYKDFPDDKLMKNKETVGGTIINRPCFFAFKDDKNPEIKWIVPISSQTAKFRKLEQQRIEKFGSCVTIRFGEVLGRDAAFLIQNMCPVTQDYLKPYTDLNNQFIKTDDRTSRDVEKHAKDVLVMRRRGVKVIFPDVEKIYNTLSAQLEQKRSPQPVQPTNQPEVTQQATAGVKPETNPPKRPMKDLIAEAKEMAAAQNQQRPSTPQVKKDTLEK